jgi:hypothetical protein
VTINNNAGLFKSGNWNENNLNPLSRINWRASLVPAAAVIPAPIAYTKVVAVKKLVVGFLEMNPGPFLTGCVPGIHCHLRDKHVWHLLVGHGNLVIYCE